MNVLLLICALVTFVSIGLLLIRITQKLLIHFNIFLYDKDYLNLLVKINNLENNNSNLQEKVNDLKAINQELINKLDTTEAKLIQTLIPQTSYKR